MWRHPLLLVLLALSVLTSAAGGAYVIAEREAQASLVEEGKRALADGNYLASLVSFSELKSKVPNDPAIADGAAQSEEFLVADKLLVRARAAAEEGDWLSVRALLEASGAATKSSFAGYDEALTLLANATAKVSILEEKITSELLLLKQEASAERNARQLLQSEKSRVETRFETARQENEARETALKEKLSETASEAQAAKEVADKERLQKFVNELAVYVGLLENGMKDLDSARADADAKRDTSALIYLNQGNAFFDEVREKAEGLLASRTPSGLENRVRDLVKAGTLLVSASRSFGNMVLYIDEEGGDFNAHKVAGQLTQADAGKLVQELKSFISANR